MSTSVHFKRRLLGALQIALKPIANALLMAGIDYRQFDETAKKAFVNAAVANHGKKGRPANTSQVANITRISRKNVSRIREVIEADSHIHDDEHFHLAVLIDIWYSNPIYCDDSGKPSRLTLDSGELNFGTLCSFLNSDASPESMLHRLVATGSIEEIEPGIFRPIRHNMRPAIKAERLEKSLFMPLFSLASTIDHNFTVERSAARLERTVYVQSHNSIDLKRIRYTSKERCDNFVESMNDLYKTCEVPNKSVPIDQIRTIGIGVYFFEHEGLWHTQSVPTQDS